MKSGTGEGVVTPREAREKFQYKYQTLSNNILFWWKFALITLTSTRDLGFKILVVDMALC